MSSSPALIFIKETNVNMYLISASKILQNVLEHKWNSSLRSFHNYKYINMHLILASTILHKGTSASKQVCTHSDHLPGTCIHSSVFCLYHLPNITPNVCYSSINSTVLNSNHR